MAGNSEEENLILTENEETILEYEDATQLPLTDFTTRNPNGNFDSLRQSGKAVRLTPLRIFLITFTQLVLCAGIIVGVHFLWTNPLSPEPNSDHHTDSIPITTRSFHTSKRPTTTAPSFVPTSTSSTTTSTISSTTTGGQPHHPKDGRFENCDDVCYFVKSGKIKSNPVGFSTQGTEIKLYPKAYKGKSIQVYCQCTIDGGWAVFQRRFDGSVDFNRTWLDYKQGFGSLSGEFWLGLQALSTFTHDGPVEMRVDLKNWKSKSAYAKYATFTTSFEFLGYYIVTGGYTGTAGDSLASHNGVAFDTYDKPNQRNFPGPSCSSMYGGGWWYTNCAISSLNGKTSENIFWSSWDDGNIVATEMKIKPV